MQSGTLFPTHDQASTQTRLAEQTLLAIPLLQAGCLDDNTDDWAYQAIVLMQNEHRHLCTVLRRLMQAAQQPADAIPDGPIGLDHVAFQSMLQELENLTLQHHHHEEQVLHRLLRQRHPDSDRLLELIASDHTHELGLIAAVETALFTCPDRAAGHDEALLELQARIEQLVRHVWAHMALEERSLLPQAGEHLSDSDWREVARAFDARPPHEIQPDPHRRPDGTAIIAPHESLAVAPAAVPVRTAA